MKHRPNILFINLDQLRYDCLGCTGHPLLKTPHIDALARSGLQ
jgi:arylsulfatase A-like enzyme